jgi:hypothetical protein
VKLFIFAILGLLPFYLHAQENVLRFPRPELAFEMGGSPTPTEQRERVRVYCTDYVRAFAAQFLAMNGFGENFFPMDQVVKAVNDDVDSIPIPDLSNMKELSKRSERLHEQMVKLAQSLYGAKKQRTTLTGQSAAISYARIEDMDKRVRSLEDGQTQLGSLLQRIEMLEQKLTALQQTKPGITVAPVVEERVNSQKIAFAALVFAFGAFALQLYGRRKS